MGIYTQFSKNPGWEQAAELLDQSFPLATGSHRDVTAYLVYFEHLLAIQADGSATGLATPTQFVDVQGSRENPLAIVLEHQGMQVEIEPAPCRAPARLSGSAMNNRSKQATPDHTEYKQRRSVVEHRLQLLTLKPAA